MEKTKYHGQFVKVTEEEIEGNIWERVYLKDGVIIFPLNENDEILMIEERRPHENHPIRLKFVTGQIDGDEDPLLTANRELQEEIGKKADNLETLLHKETSGTINNHLFQVLAYNLSDSKIPNPDGEDTIVSVKAFSIREIEDMFESETLPMNLSYFGFLKVKKWLKNKKAP